MSNERHCVFAVLAGVAIFVLGMLTLVVPNYREGSERLHRTRMLVEKASHLNRNEQQVELLANEVKSLEHFRESELKRIPDHPGIPELMGKLSLPVDGITINDQEFIRGEPTGASNQESLHEMCVPLTVEMDAHFDSIFALIRAAESMRRLIRVASVRLHCDRGMAEEVDTPMISATVRLEAVYVADAGEAEE